MGNTNRRRRRRTGRIPRIVDARETVVVASDDSAVVVVAAAADAVVGGVSVGEGEGAGERRRQRVTGGVLGRRRGALQSGQSRDDGGGDGQRWDVLVLVAHLHDGEHADGL